MEVFTTRAALAEYLNRHRSAGKTIGFAPTMGALHQGHLSLIATAARQTDLVVCSIFVNPTQFTESKDLENYPRPIESDKAKLAESRCDVLFLPAVDEMYGQDEKWHIDLGQLDRLLEGEMRPGHYQGVTQIVKKLFDAVKPDKAFFGQKDYQQVLVIQRMVDQLDIPVELVMCPIVREADGLAMSSRNIHLSTDEHQQALALSRSLNLAAAEFPQKSLAEIRNDALRFLNDSRGVDVEYFEICDSRTLEPAEADAKNGLVALVAARVGKTRLIDNIILR